MLFGTIRSTESGDSGRSNFTVTIRNIACLILAVFAKLSLQRETVILTYHSVGSNQDFYTVNPREFRRQIDFLRSNYSIIPLSDMLDFAKNKKDVPKKSVSITFDDGYEDFYVNVYPYLRKHNLPATVFVATEYVGKEWPLSGCGHKMLFWSEILEIAGNNIEIGAHTITHPNLQEEDSEEAEYEIVKSKSKLEERLRKTVRFFSYPFGRHNHQIREIVRDSGFEGAVGGTGTLSTGSCVFALNRVQIDRSISFLQFRVHLTKAADWSREIEQTIRALLRRRQV